MKLYHRTERADQILEGGFVDGAGGYLTAEEWGGVWFADRPLDPNEGAHGGDVLVVETGDQDLDAWEWIEEGKPYREWMIPASVANAWPVRMVEGLPS